MALTANECKSLLETLSASHRLDIASNELGALEDKYRVVYKTNDNRIFIRIYSLVHDIYEEVEVSLED